MLKKFALALFALTLAIGCSKQATVNTSSGNSNVRKADGKIDVGDQVIVPYTTVKGMFHRARVEEINGSRARVVQVEDIGSDTYRPTLQRQEVDLADVYEIPDKGVKQEVKAGDIVLAQDSVGRGVVFWRGVEVVAIEEMGARVKALGNDKRDWTAMPGYLIIPSAKTLAELKQRGDDSSFLAEARKHKLARVEGYTPKVGDHVLAEANVGSWHAGTVSTIQKGRDGGVHTMGIKYDDPNNGLRDPVYTAVPFPTAAKSAAPAEGQYLLVKPTTGDRWLYAQVTKVDGQSAEVRIEDGTTRTVAPGEFIALQ